MKLELSDGSAPNQQPDSGVRHEWFSVGACVQTKLPVLFTPIVSLLGFLPNASLPLPGRDGGEVTGEQAVMRSLSDLPSRDPKTNEQPATLGAGQYPPNFSDPKRPPLNLTTGQIMVIAKGP